MPQFRRIPGNFSYASVQAPFGSIFFAHGDGFLFLLAENKKDLLTSCRRMYGTVPMVSAVEGELVGRTILAAVEGKSRDRSILYLPRLTDFQRRVLQKLGEIPRGEVRSYLWLAAAVGRSGAVRAVGNVLAWNPFPFLLPCHRVIHADGRLGQYSAGGSTSKARILAFEGVPVRQQGRSGDWRISKNNVPPGVL